MRQPTTLPLLLSTVILSSRIPTRSAADCVASNGHEAAVAAVVGPVETGLDGGCDAGRVPTTVWVRTTVDGDDGEPPLFAVQAPRALAPSRAATKPPMRRAPDPMPADASLPVPGPATRSEHVSQVGARATRKSAPTDLE